MPSLLSRNLTLALAVKKRAKIDLKLILSCPILLDFSILFQLICPGLSEQTDFFAITWPSLLQTSIYLHFL